MTETFPTQTAQPQTWRSPTRSSARPAGARAAAAVRCPRWPFTLANGVKVYLVDINDLPLISLELNFDGGTLADPPGKAGLAETCMDLVTEGTATLDKLGFSSALADIASHISSYASDDSQGVAMSTLSAHWEPTLRLFADSVRTPACARTTSIAW
ncbi:MAG: insulinase family protein [Kofleriaceae bacterium]